MSSGNCLVEPAHGILVHIAYPSIQCSDESAHARSLARALATRRRKVWLSMKAQAKNHGLVSYARFSNGYASKIS